MFDNIICSYDFENESIKIGVIFFLFVAINCKLPLIQYYQLLVTSIAELSMQCIQLLFSDGNLMNSVH